MISYTYGAVEAVTTQLQALEILNRVLKLTRPETTELHESFSRDCAMLRVAAPFAWTKETSAATLAASRSVPLDTTLNVWNLPGIAAFWHFEEPLPITTVDEPKGIRALLFGRVPGEHTHAEPRYLISAFVDDMITNGLGPLPSQIFTWRFERTVAEVLEDSKQKHRLLYGPGGRWHARALAGQIVGEGPFLAATEAIARFILAGMSWISSKVVAADVQHVERHRRKEYERKLGRACYVKLVQLRRTERHATDQAPDPEAPKREWSCQWQVDGHFRNQRVGTGRAQTRLTWVSPHIKGPDDKPLVVPKHKVFVVSR